MDIDALCAVGNDPNRFEARLNIANVFRRCHALGNGYDVRKIRVCFSDDAGITALFKLS